MNPEILKLITIAASLIISVRILLYRRDGQFKRCFSMVAWALAFFMTAQAITLLLSSSAQTTFYQAGTAIFLMIAVVRKKGNVACFFHKDIK